MIAIALKGKGGFVALIDDEDRHLAAHDWYPTTNGRGVVYAQRKVKCSDGRTRNEYLHRAVMRTGPGQRVDHESRDGLDCRRHNLRLATPTQNLCNQRKRSDNTSGFRGVWRDRHGRWRAEVGFQHVRRRLGPFDTAEQAARAYDDAARELHGPFASLNFPVGEERAA